MAQNGSSRRAKCADVEESQEHDLGQAKNPYAVGSNGGKRCSGDDDADCAVLDWKSGWAH